MKALIVGGAGQLGRSLVDAAPAGAEVIARDRATLDITDAEAVTRAIGEITPDLVLNAAGFTAVDRAEAEAETALAVNGTAVSHLARAAAASGARFVHISSDFVFDGRASRPYPPDAEPAPLSAYGRSKLVGERAAGVEALIVRTAWVHAAGGANFVATMLRLMAERAEVRVVADQIGTPTWAPSLARALWALAAQGATGVHHYTDAGVASWYDFAVAIREEALAAGLLADAARVVPVTTADFPTSAARPAFSVLDKSATWAALGAPAAHWRETLRRHIAELAHG